jgi:four helix bundle protein
MSNNLKAEVRSRKAEGKTAVPMVQRTKAFALRVMKLVDALPRTRSADVIGRQLLRSATSVGANYRASQRARSKAEFIAKLGIVEEEADESGYWLELLSDGGLVPARRLADLLKEADEITAIVVTSLRVAKRNSQKAAKR